MPEPPARVCWLRRAITGWCIVFAFAAVWDAVAAPGQKLSHATQRARSSPVLLAAMAGMCAHLLGFLPKRWDPLHAAGNKVDAWHELRRLRKAAG